MKRIVFNAVLPPKDTASPYIEHRLYSVYLGNKTWCYFSSTRHAEQFQAAAERFLNDAMFRANLVLVDVYPAWRMAWYYMDHIKADLDRSTMQAVRDAEAAMDRALKRRGGADYTLYAWKDVTTAVVQLRQVVLTMVDLYRTKGHGVDRNRLEVVLGTCNDLLDRMQHYGTTHDDAPNAVAIKRLPALPATFGDPPM